MSTFDCAICGAQGVDDRRHFHEPSLGRIYDRRPPEYSMVFLGWKPIDPVKSLFSRFGILEWGDTE